jgi:hypothetical protein
MGFRNYMIGGWCVSLGSAITYGFLGTIGMQISVYSLLPIIILITGGGLIFSNIFYKNLNDKKMVN